MVIILTAYNFKEITYVEGLKDYIQIHISTSPKATVARMSMKSVEEQLLAYFGRIHKSFIVNINKAEVFEKLLK